MPNPSGPYPGRQVFLGLTTSGKPCFVYLVTGRSPESRQRKAVARENSVIMGPLGNAQYDPLRHYTAVKYDNTSGIAAVTNGIQTEAIFETYKLLYNVGTPPTQEFIAKIMDGARAEPDSLHTPRVAGVITGKEKPIFILSIITDGVPAAAYPVAADAGHIAGVSVYKGDMDKPEPTNPTARLSWLEFSGSTPQELAKFLFEMSAADYKGDDIRVCTVSGIYSDGAWHTAIINRF